LYVENVHMGGKVRIARKWILQY